MSLLTYQYGTAKNMKLIDSFYGLNKRFRIAENEFSDIKNMCSDDFPALSTRKKRKGFSFFFNGADVGLPAVFEKTISSAVVVDDYIATLSTDGEFSYKEFSTNLDITDNKMFRIGNQIYCYPSGTLITLTINENEWLKVEKTQQVVSIRDDEYGKIQLYPAVPEGIGKTTYAPVEPTEPEIGDYWYHDSILERYCGEDEGWISVVPSLIRITALSSGTNQQGAVADILSGNKFRVGDAVFLTGTESEYDGAYIVEQKRTEDSECLYLQGTILKAQSFSKGCIERKMPVLDFVTEHNGRLWGCRYGYNSDGDFVNEIYASALNNPFNWFRYSGTSQDSYAASVTSDGKFTGVHIVNGYITFFKESYMHRIYGNGPSSFQLYSQPCIGIQEGCEASAANVNGVTYYKSNVGIMAMSDGLPVNVSSALGDEVFTDAVAGTDTKKYYVAMLNADSERVLYSYSIDTKIWHKEDCPDDLRNFFSYKNNLFCFCDFAPREYSELDALLAKYKKMMEAEPLNSLKYITAKLYVKLLESSKGNSIICLSSTDNIIFPKTKIADEDGNYTVVDMTPYDEKDFIWSFETTDISYSDFNKKYISQIISKILILPGARVDIDIKYNFRPEWTPVSTLAGAGTINSELVTIRPARCSHFRLRFSGIGDVKLCGLAFYYNEGNEK